MRAAMSLAAPSVVRRCGSSLRSSSPSSSSSSSEKSWQKASLPRRTVLAGGEPDRSVKKEGEGLREGLLPGDRAFFSLSLPSFHRWF